MKDREGLYKMRLLAKINRLSFDYQLVQLCIEYLKTGYSKAVADTLRLHIRVDGDLNPQDTTSYFRILDTVVTRSSRMKIQIDDKRAEYKVLNQRKGDGRATATSQHFASLIGQVSRFMKFHINRMEISAGEFVAYYGMMREENEAIETLNAKNKR